MYFIHYNPPSILEAFHSHPFASLFTLAVWIMVMLFVWSSLSTESESRGDSIMFVSGGLTAAYSVIGFFGVCWAIYDWGSEIGAINYFLAMTVAAAAAVFTLFGILIGMRYKKPEVRK